MNNLYTKVYKRLVHDMYARFSFLRKRQHINKYNDYMYLDRKNSFHGDEMLMLIIKEIFSLNITSFVETGTFLGASTYFACTNFSGPVFSFEKVEEIYEQAKGNLSETKAQLFLEDSAHGLAKYVEQFGIFPFFYLDAHYKWAEHSPLPGELELITKLEKSIIIIDDFKVPGTQDYRYDTIFDFSRNPRSYSSKDLDFEYVNKYLDRSKTYNFFVPDYPDSAYKKYNGYLIVIMGDVNRDTLSFFERHTYLRAI